MENKKAEAEIDIGGMLCILRKDFKTLCVVALCCVLLAATVLWAKQGTPRYESEACLWIKSTQYVLLGQELVESNNELLSINVDKSYYDQLSPAEMQNCVELLQSKSVLQPVTEALGETGMITAEPLGKSEMLKVKFSASDAEKAHRGNELLLQSFSRHLSNMGQSKTKYIMGHKAVEQTEWVSPQVAASISSQIEAQIIDPPSFPTAPVALKWKMTIAVSTLLGIIIGSGFVLARALTSPKMVE